MGKKLYAYDELEAYFNKHGMEWVGYVLDIYCVEYKDEDRYVIDDYNYASQKGIKYSLHFDFTENSVDWENVEDIVKYYNEDHDDKIEIDNEVIAGYIIDCIDNKEIRMSY
ncbi:MAG: hypothetical protein ACP5G8_09040 [Athalassotoga sp.]